MMTFLSTIFIILSLTFAVDPTSKGLVDENFKKEDFKKHMLQHFFSGCPTNSQCTKSLGAKLNFWEKALKEKDIKSFVKKYGVPVSSWSMIKNPSEDQDVILWDSPCKHHQKDKQDQDSQAVRYALSFEKKLNNLNKEQKFFRVIQLKRDNEIIRFLGPRDSYPTSLKKNTIHYVQEFNGHYYNLFVDKKGNLSVSLDIIKTPDSESISCPDSLKVQDKFAQRIYQGHSCKKIWNFDLKKYEIIQLGWSC